MPKLYFITSNENKLKEAKKIIPEIEGLNLDVPEIQSLDSHEVIKHKLNEAKKVHNGNFVVEDVSVTLECLNSLPGPFIKWFLNSLGKEGLVKLVKMHDNDKAVVKCVIGLSIGSKAEFFEGVVKGRIVEPRGQSNFGFDPIFQPDGHEKTYAEMSMEEKNKISHRSLALEKLKDYLK